MFDARIQSRAMRLCGCVGASFVLLDSNFFSPASGDLSHGLRVVTQRPAKAPGWVLRHADVAKGNFGSPVVIMLHVLLRSGLELALKAYHVGVFLAFMAVSTRAFLDAAAQEDEDLGILGLATGIKIFLDYGLD